MKANEFVKKFGWVHSKYIAEKWYNTHKSFDTKTYHTTYYQDNSGETSLVELKRLVESYELVESLVRVYKSIDVVKEKASYCMCNECKNTLKAIADVESCQ